MTITGNKDFKMIIWWCFFVFFSDRHFMQSHTAQTHTHTHTCAEHITVTSRTRLTIHTLSWPYSACNMSNFLDWRKDTALSYILCVCLFLYAYVEDEVQCELNIARCRTPSSLVCIEHVLYNLMASMLPFNEIPSLWNVLHTSCWEKRAISVLILELERASDWKIKGSK